MARVPRRGLPRASRDFIASPFDGVRPSVAPGSGTLSERPQTPCRPVAGDFPVPDPHGPLGQRTIKSTGSTIRTVRVFRRNFSPPSASNEWTQERGKPPAPRFSTFSTPCGKRVQRNAKPAAIPRESGKKPPPSGSWPRHCPHHRVERNTAAHTGTAAGRPGTPVFRPAPRPAGPRNRVPATETNAGTAGNAGLQTGTVARRATKSRTANRNQARGPLGAPTSGRHRGPLGRERPPPFRPAVSSGTSRHLL